MSNVLARCTHALAYSALVCVSKACTCCSITSVSSPDAWNAAFISGVCGQFCTHMGGFLKPLRSLAESLQPYAQPPTDTNTSTLFLCSASTVSGSMRGFANASTRRFSTISQLSTRLTSVER